MIKKLLPRSLFGRSLLLIITPLILLQGVVVLIFYERHWDSVSRRLALGLAGDLAVAIQTMQESPNAWAQAEFLARVERHMSLKIEMEPGAILPNIAPRLTNRILDRVLLKALSEQLVYPFQIDTRGFKESIEIKIQLAEGVLTVLTPRKRIFSSTTYIFVMWMVGTSILLIAVAVVFLNNQMKPIRRLAQAAEDFGKGRPVTHFKPEGASEIRQAAAAFLDMQARIQRQIQQRTDMLAGVSHDLRTPLTRMKLQLAMIEPAEGMGALQNEVAEMEKMIDEYLAFSRGEAAEKPVPTELRTLLEEVVDGARREGSTITLSAEGEMMLHLRPNAIKRGLTNLVENAARYGTKVEVSAARRGDMIEIAIDDDGPGIPEAEREAVFKPFYRIDESRNPETGGVGLGLTIARDAIRAHGGDITLSQSRKGGLRALLRLPV